MWRSIKQLSSTQILFLFLVVAFVIRFPFFFRDYVDHDESTFILMGQALVDGHLPYVTYWDLKPPLVFYFFAGIIAVFGKSMLMIRAMGSIVVGLSAWYSYQFSLAYLSKVPSFFAGLLSIYLLSLFGAMQGVMSEHLAVLPLMIGMYYLTKKHSFALLLWVGFLFGLSLMLRLNLAYALFFVNAWVCLAAGLNVKSIKKGIGLVAGITIAIILCILPYILTQQIDLIKTSVIDASMAYSSSTKQTIKTLPLIGVIIVLCGLTYQFLRPKLSSYLFYLLIIMLLGQALMFLQSGKVNGHYLIQIFPILAIVLIGLLSQIKLSAKLKSIVPKVVLGLFILLPMESYLELGTLFKSKKEDSFYNGEGYSVARYLSQNYTNDQSKNVFFLNEHIGYWLLDAMPPTAIAMHPSNLVRTTAFDFVSNAKATPIEEMQYILEVKKPTFIIVDEDRNQIRGNAETYAYLKDKLAQDYQIEKTFTQDKSVKIYHLKQ